MKAEVDADCPGAQGGLGAASLAALSERRLSSTNDEFLFSVSRLTMRVFLKPDNDPKLKF